MAPRRKLRAAPSDVGSLDAGQVRLHELIGELDSKAAKSTMYEVISDALGKRDALGELTAMRMACYDETEEVAAQASHLLLAQCAKTEEQLRKVTVYSFTYAEDSFWRGIPPARLLVRLAKSMVSTGYRANEPLASRTAEVVPDSEGRVVDSLLFGDGAARGLAARLVWNLMLQNRDLLVASAALQGVAKSFMSIPCTFTVFGEGTADEQLVACIAIQNQRAEATTVSTMEWIHLLLRRNPHLKLGSRCSQRLAA